MSKDVREVAVETLVDFFVYAIKWYANRRLYSDIVEKMKKLEKEEAGEVEEEVLRALMLPRQIKSISVDGNNKVVIELEGGEHEAKASR